MFVEHSMVRRAWAETSLPLRGQADRYSAEQGSLGHGKGR